MTDDAFHAMGFQERIPDPCACRCLEGSRNSAVEFIPLNGTRKIISKPALDWSCNQQRNSKPAYVLAALGNDNIFCTSLYLHCEHLCNFSFLRTILFLGRKLLYLPSLFITMISQSERTKDSRNRNVTDLAPTV